MAVEKNALPPKITLRAARTNPGLSAKDVAKITDEHYQTILNYEKDNSDISRSLLEEISEVYRYPTDFIF